MEDYLFKTYFKMTYDEYKKMYGASLRKHWKLYALCFSIPLLTSITDIIEGRSLLGLLLCYLIFIAVFFITYICVRPIKYKRNRHINQFEATTYFFDERIEAETPISHIKLNYSELNLIIETKTNFYLYITPRQLLIVSKGDCTPDNIAFIQNIAGSVNGRKK